MKIFNQLFHVIELPKFQENMKKQRYLTMMVVSEDGISSGRALPKNRTQYVLRCHGQIEWLESIKQKATVGSELMVSGEDQQKFHRKGDGGSFPVTEIVVKNPKDLSFIERRVAS